MEIFKLLHRAGQRADSAFSQAIGKTDLTARQFAVISVIHSRKFCGQVEVVEETGIDRSTVAEIIGRLEKSGRVKRKRSAEDARRYELALTRQGEKDFAAGRDATKKAEQLLVSVLKPNGARTLEELLETVCIGIIPHKEAA